MKVKEMFEEQRPREKALRYGLESLSDLELVALLLQSGNKQRSVFDIAQDVLNMTHGLSRLFDMHVNALMEIQGIREVKALNLLAGVELCKRAKRKGVYGKTIHTPEDVIDWFSFEYGTKAQEHFVAVYINTKGRIITHRVLFVGTINQSCVSPREIFKEAYLENAYGVIVLHNHPSGDCTPSQEDILCTRQLMEVATIMSIHFIDHIIIGKNSYYSFMEHHEKSF